MPYTKTASGTITAIGADDIDAVIYKSDAGAPVPNEYHFELRVREQHPDGRIVQTSSAIAIPNLGGVPAVGGEFGLTQTETQTLRQLLNRLKENRLKAMNFALT